MTKVYDVIFAGGGVMGCAVAYELLKRDPALHIAIIEKDPSYKFNSTVLSDGNIRVQFNVQENILMSLYGLEMLNRFAEEMAVRDEKPDIQFRRVGNLFLVDDSKRDSALAGMALQRGFNAKVDWLEADQIHDKYPFIDPQTIAGGTFSPGDGTMDPYAVLKAYKDKCVAMDAEFIVAEVTAINKSGQQINGVALADGRTLSGKTVVNSAGAWGAELAKTVGVDLPIEPTMRHVFHIEAPVSSEVILPLIVFPSGIYIHHEHDNHFVTGRSTPVDFKGFDFTFKRNLFTEYFWEELATYMPEFERLKVIDGWTGLYAVNTFDGNAILGEWPELKGLIIVGGFSGHGFQQCFAIGAYLADVILGNQPELDLSIFSPARILNGQPVYENAHKLV